MAKVGEPTIILDSDRLMKWVRKTHTGTVGSSAQKVATSVRGKVPPGVKVVVNHHISAAGRPVSVVTIAHASGMALQAQRGVLTSSAAENGLNVTRTEAT